MQTKSAVWPRISLAIWLGLLLAGCAASRRPAYEGPSDPAPVEMKRWVFGREPGAVIKTAHYNIYTTVASSDVQNSVAQVMEGALSEYQKVAPGVPLTDKPMDCYLFKSREQWMDFTRRKTGPAAGIYLQ